VKVVELRVAAFSTFTSYNQELLLDNCPIIGQKCGWCYILSASRIATEFSGVELSWVGF